MALEGGQISSGSQSLQPEDKYGRICPIASATFELDYRCENSTMTIQYA